MHNIKDGNQSNENLGETIENYKAQIGKYHKIIMSDEWDEKTEIMSQPVMMEHKKKLNKAKEEKNRTICYFGRGVGEFASQASHRWQDTGLSRTEEVVEYLH